MKEMLEEDTFKDKTILINDANVTDIRVKAGAEYNTYINENIKIDIVDLS
jgi:hypothetical protein